MFSCEYRGGRAGSAPQLRTQTEDNGDGVHAVSVDQEKFQYDGPEAEMHDPHVLPHHYPDEDLERMFPKAHAGDNDHEIYADLDVDDTGRYAGKI